LNSLKTAGVKATFHICPDYFLGQTNLIAHVERIKAEGHVVGLRFQGDPRSISSEALQKQLVDDSKKIYDLLNVYPKFLRFPYGQFGSREIEIANCMGFVVTEWNVDSYDYLIKQTGPIIVDALLNEYIKRFNLVSAGEGRYISLHSDTLKIYDNETYLAEALKYVQNYKYNTVTLDKCLSETSAYRSTNVVCNNNTDNVNQGQSTNTADNQKKSCSEKAYALNQTLQLVILFLALIFVFKA
jgi:peptidoglycan/xylan/chitin deacetylase (PgdA/CDA1 family)